VNGLVGEGVVAWNGFFRSVLAPNEKLNPPEGGAAAGVVVAAEGVVPKVKGAGALELADWLAPNENGAGVSAGVVDAALLKENVLFAVVGVINGVVDGAPKEKVALVGVLVGDSSFADGTGRTGLGVPSKVNGVPSGVVVPRGAGELDGNENPGFCGDGVPAEIVVGVAGVVLALPNEKGAGCLTGVVTASLVVDVGGAPNENGGSTSFFGSAGVTPLVPAVGKLNSDLGALWLG
jgi:hypothetical protein